MKIPTEPIGSIPRPIELIEGMKANAAGRLSNDEMNKLFDRCAGHHPAFRSNRLTGDYRW